MKKLKNKFKEILDLIMFTIFIVNIVPSALAFDGKNIEEANNQRRTYITSEYSVNMENEIIEEEPEKPGEETKPEEEEPEKPGEETKPDEEEPEKPGEETKPDEEEQEKPGEETKPDEEEPEKPGEETKPEEPEEPGKEPEEPEEPGKEPGKEPGEETKPDEEEPSKEPEEPDVEEPEPEKPSKDMNPKEPGEDEEQDEPAEEVKIENPGQLSERFNEIIPDKAPNNFTPEQVEEDTYEIPKTGDKNSILLDIAIVLTFVTGTTMAILSINKRKKQK